MYFLARCSSALACSRFLFLFSLALMFFWETFVPVGADVSGLELLFEFFTWWLLAAFHLTLGIIFPRFVMIMPDVGRCRMH